MRRILCVFSPNLYLDQAESLKTGPIRIPTVSTGPAALGPNGLPERELRLLRNYSPWVGFEESADCRSLVLDISGCWHLFGGEERMARRIVRDLQRLGLRARVGIADTIGAAWAVARFHQQNLFVIPAGKQRDILAPLPIEALRISAEVADVLRDVGIDTIGRLMSLPRSTLPSRFGEELLKRLDQALGDRPELIAILRLEEPVEARAGCEPPLERLCDVETLLRRLLRQVTRQLERRNLGILELEIELTGRSPQRLAVGVVRPTLHRKRLLRLARLQLEQLDAASGNASRESCGSVAGMILRVVRTGSLDLEQSALFETADCRRVRKDLDSLVNRLSNRLGRQAVLCPKLRPDYQPEWAVEYQPLLNHSSLLHRGGKENAGRNSAKRRTLRKRQEPEEKKTWSPQRPLRLFPCPMPAFVWSIVPDGPPMRVRWRGEDQAIVHCEGPEKIETGWWRSGAARREYFRADTETGRRLWLFRSCEESGGWFVHGEF